MAEIDNLSLDTTRLSEDSNKNIDDFCKAVQKGDTVSQENFRLKAHVLLDMMFDNLHRSQIILKQTLGG